MDDRAVCNNYANFLTPHKDKELMRKLARVAMPYVPKRRIVICLTGGSPIGRVLRSDIFFEYVKKDGKEAFVDGGWVIAFHRDFVQEMPEDILDAVIGHEVGHLALRHYARCALQFGSGKIEEYKECELEADRFAGKLVGYCKIAEALRFTFDFLGRHDAHAEFDYLLLRRAESLETIGQCAKKR